VLRWWIVRLFAFPLWKAFILTGRLSNFGFEIFSLPACVNSKSQWSGEEHWWPQSRKSRLGTQRVIALYLFCVSPSRSSRDSSTLVSNQSSTHCSHRNRWVLTQEVDCRSGHLADTGHWRELFGYKSHSNLWHCIVLRPHLQAALIATW